MSNPSQEKAPVLLKSDQAKEDPRGVRTSEQQAEERCRDTVHQVRAEQTKQTEQKIIKTGIEKNILINPGDGKEVEKVPPGYHKVEGSAQAKSGTSYPEAQPSYDAKGNLNHIDILPNKNL